MMVTLLSLEMVDVESQWGSRRWKQVMEQVMGVKVEKQVKQAQEWVDQVSQEDAMRHPMTYRAPVSL